MIIGSCAIKYWFPDFPREPKDVDIIIREDKEADDSAFEQMLNEDYSTLREERLANPILQNYVDGHNICPKDVLYTLKVSHLFWDINWTKHIWDVQFLKEKGCKLDYELLTRLHGYWQTEHPAVRRSNLNMTAEKFFDNVVGFPIHHDELHKMLIKHPYFENQEEPSYKQILEEGAEVNVDHNLIHKCDDKTKFNLVFEETSVMAHERYTNEYYKAAYNKMLKKFIISHAPFPLAVWAIQNHKQLLTNIPFNFHEHLRQQYS